MKGLLSLLFSALLSFLLSIPANGQDRLVMNYGYGLWFGIRDVQPEIFDDGGHLDFLNYLESSVDYPEYQILGMNFWFIFNNNLELDTKFAVCSDLKLSNYNLKARLSLNKYIGLSAGYYRFPQYMSNFDAWYLNKNEEFYENIPGNYAQIRVFESGLTSGIYLDYKLGILNLRLDLNGGLTTLSKFDVVFDRKEKESNFKQRIVYDVFYSPSLFFFPELTIHLDLVSFTHFTLGFQTKANWMYLNRSLDYMQTTYSWTYEDKIREEISNPVHTFTKYECDFGFFLRW